MKSYQEIERSIITKFRKDIWSKFIKAVIDYKLIETNDNIMVCISGGKDSFLLAKLMQEVQAHGKYPFNIHFVVMDPGYKEKNRRLIEDNARKLNIPIEIYESDIFEVIDRNFQNVQCYMCARMRRGFLYSKAKELGCNKIALGHHFDDVIETSLLSMFYASEIKTMLPKLHSDNFKGIDLIRPMYLIKESSIISWKKYNELEFLNCACKFTEQDSNNELTSKRREIKDLIKELKKNNPNIDNHIFKALDNVNIDCVLGYTKNRKKHTFIEEFDKDKDI